jgi:SAM-dependent methyltransferase
VGRLFARAHRLFNHLAAGTLRIDDLREGIKHPWERSEASDDAMAAGLMPWEEDLISEFVKHDELVLLIGSGPGRDLVALAAKGYRVTGVEPARRAVATARRHLERRGLSADIIEGFFEDVPLPGRYDAIVFSYCCYSFIPESGRRIGVLRKAADHLTEGGRVLISYLAQPEGHPAWIQFARIAATVSRSDWHPERGDVLHALDIAQPLFHYQHPFTAAEIDAEAVAAGLRVAYRRDIRETPVVVLMRAPAEVSTHPVAEGVDD